MIVVTRIDTNHGDRMVLQTHELVEAGEEEADGNPMAAHAVVITWEGQFDRDAGKWTFHAVGRLRNFAGASNQGPHPTKVRAGHGTRLRRELASDPEHGELGVANFEVHAVSPLYCPVCDGRLADSHRAPSDHSTVLGL